MAWWHCAPEAQPGDYFTKACRRHCEVGDDFLSCFVSIAWEAAAAAKQPLFARASKCWRVAEISTFLWNISYISRPAQCCARKFFFVEMFQGWMCSCVRFWFPSAFQCVSLRCLVPKANEPEIHVGNDYRWYCVNWMASTGASLYSISYESVVIIFDYHSLLIQTYFSVWALHAWMDRTTSSCMLFFIYHLWISSPP